jgi:hypothetical protein
MSERVRLYYTADPDEGPTIHRVAAGGSQPWEAWASRTWELITQISALEALAAVEHGARLVDLDVTGRQATAEILSVQDNA